MTPYQKRMIKKQMLEPVMKCVKQNVFCRFAAPGFCLIMFDECEYALGLGGFEERRVNSK